MDTGMLLSFLAVLSRRADYEHALATVDMFPSLHALGAVRFSVFLPHRAY